MASDGLTEATLESHALEAWPCPECEGPHTVADIRADDPGAGHSVACTLYRAKLPIPPEGLWDECSEWVWLPLSYGDDATRVKRKAYVGVDLPFSPAREAFLEYGPIEVSKGFVRPGYPTESGWSGNGPDCWHRCESDHPRAVEAWVVNFGG